MQILNERDSIVDDFFYTFSEIQDNLNTIKAKENIINLNAKNAEDAPEIKEQINKDIQTIYNLLLENKEKLKRLENKFKKAGLKIKALKKTIATLEKQILEKDAEIKQLKEKLDAMNIQITLLETNIDSLTIENIKKDETINNQDIKLHTAHYVIGTKKELYKNGIITKSGGFIGIGRIKKLKEDFNKDYFTTIDIREVKEIPIVSKKVKIITTHPKDSYELIKNEKGVVETLKINNPEKFWSISKYLVVIVQ